jgi:hypothetical protein
MQVQIIVCATLSFVVAITNAKEQRNRNFGGEIIAVLQTKFPHQFAEISPPFFS